MPAATPHPDAARWGLIAGNGRFPFLVLEGARSQQIDMAVLAIREEAAPELEKIAPRLHWVSLGELGRALELFHEERVTHAVMAGQVQHNKIFSSIRPDWKMAKLLLSLATKNTDSLIGAVAKLLEDEGICLVDSTRFLEPLLPAPGVLTRRAPDAAEQADISYGREDARRICQNTDERHDRTKTRGLGYRPSARQHSQKSKLHPATRRYVSKHPGNKRRKPDLRHRTRCQA